MFDAHTYVSRNSWRLGTEATAPPSVRLTEVMESVGHPVSPRMHVGLFVASSQIETSVEFQ